MITLVTFWQSYYWLVRARSSFENVIGSLIARRFRDFGGDEPSCYSHRWMSFHWTRVG